MARNKDLSSVTRQSILVLRNKKIKMVIRRHTLDRGTLPRRPASRSHLSTVDVETGVLRVLFNEAAS